MFEKPFDSHSFLSIAMKFYDNAQCISVKEFEDDLKKFLYLKKLFNRYYENDDLKHKLIINHLITLHNLFGIATTELLFFKTEKKHWNLLATFLVFLDRMPRSIPEFDIDINNIVIDRTVLNILEQSMNE